MKIGRRDEDGDGDLVGVELGIKLKKGGGRRDESRLFGRWGGELALYRDRL